MYHWEFEKGRLLCGGKPLITQGCEDISLESDPTGKGIYLKQKAVNRPFWGFTQLGIPTNLKRFVATYLPTENMWWMSHLASDDLSKVPPQTSVLILEHTDGTYSLIVALPSATDLHTLCFRGNKLHVMADTGDEAMNVSEGLCAFVSHGTDLMELLNKSAESIARKIPTARLRRNKKLPETINQLGWCTWNAFMHSVDQSKVRAGLESLQAAGIHPKYLILDDGWLQSKDLCLTSFEADPEKFPGGLAAMAAMVKGEFGLDKFWVWHAVDGYWGGIDPEVFAEYRPKKIPHKTHGYCQATGWYEYRRQPGMGLTLPTVRVNDFFDRFHAFLASVGVDGVKIDNQATIATTATGFGGRPRLFRIFRDAMERSVGRHLKHNLITCMAQVPEIWYHARTTNLIRSSDDFFPDQPASHGWHIYVNAMHGLWFGQFSWLDWDMFQTPHAFGAYHAAGRAVSGGPIYITDEPGEHRSELIQKLFFRDGVAARCEAPGRPTRDCIFTNPFETHQAFKVWGEVPEGYVVGLFDLDTGSEATLSAALSPEDIPGTQLSRYVIWLHEAKVGQLIARNGRVNIPLGTRKYEVATVVPVRYNSIAVIGNVNLFNAAAAVVSVERDPQDQHYRIQLREGGDFRAWMATEPKGVRVDGKLVDYQWQDGMLAVDVKADGACEVIVVRK